MSQSTSGPSGGRGNTPPNANGGCIWLVIGAAVLGVIGFSNKSNDQATAGAAVEQAPSTSLAPSSPPPIERLNIASEKQGFAHMQVSYKAEGFSGALIYSQNCYDALAHAFSWAKLDQCGGFDALTARRIPAEDPGDLSKVLAWFESETAAGRYLSAAQQAGMAPEMADERWSTLQGAAAKVPNAKPAVVQSAIPDDEYSYVDDEGNLSSPASED